MAGEWLLRPLGDLTENLDSIRVPVKENDRRRGPYPYYGASGIVDYVDGYLFDGEHLLIAEDGENLRTRNTPVAFLARGKFWVNNHAHIVRGNAKANTRFLMYAITATDISGYLTGSTMPKLTQGNMNRIPIVAPPVDEQCAIAHILGTLDDKIELNRGMNETLEATARAIFKSWFVDFDPVRRNMEKSVSPDRSRTSTDRSRTSTDYPRTSTDRSGVAADHLGGSTDRPGTSPADPGVSTNDPEKAPETAKPAKNPEFAPFFPDSFVDSELGKIPKGWRVGTVYEVANINSRTLGRHDSLDIIDYIEISEVMRGNVATITRYQRGEEPSRARRRLQHGDTALSTVRPDRGAFFLCIAPPESLIASTGFAVLTPKDGNWAFLHAMVTRRDVGEELGRLADGGAYPAIRPEVIGGFPVILPDDTGLVAAFDKLTQMLYLQAGKNRFESHTLAALRDTLLPKLLSGEIRVGDAERIVGRHA